MLELAPSLSAEINSSSHDSAVAGISASAARLARLLLVFVLSGILIFALSMSKKLDHDEHQFVASGAVLLRNGYLPYRDYPYFHMPNQVFIDAGLDRLSDHLLLAARIFNVICSALAATLLFDLTWRLLASAGRKTRITGSILTICVLLSSPIFTSTTSRAWNHDLPTLLTLIGLMALWKWRRSSRGKAVAWVVLCGITCGLATGARLTFAPAMAAFAVAMLMGFDKTRRARVVGVCALIVAAAIALAPSIWLWALSPQAFIFGNLRYPMLNTAYRLESRYQRAMTLPGKVAFVFVDVLNKPGNIALLLALLGTLWLLFSLRARSAAASAGASHRARLLHFEIVSLLLLIFSLLIGTFAPTPLWIPYFYAPVPFVILLIVCTLARHLSALQKTTSIWRHWPAALIVMSAVGIACGIPAYTPLVDLFTPVRWVPNEVHAMGAELTAQCHGGRVLTLVPIFPLEGHCDIYPQFVTGPFAARVAGLISTRDERKFHELDTSRFDQLLSHRPPAAILVGFEGRLEQPLEAYAAEKGYTPMPWPMEYDRSEMIESVGKQASEKMLYLSPMLTSRDRSRR